MHTYRARRALLGIRLFLTDDEGAGGSGGGGKPDDKPDPKPDDDKAGATGSDLGDDPEKLRAALADARKDAAKYRTKAKELEPMAAKAKALEDAGKSETEKLTGRATDAEKRAEAAERRALVLEIASEKGLTAKQANRLHGTTREELEADADELLDEFGGNDKNDGPKVRQQPRTKGRGGIDPEEEALDEDPTKLAARVPRR